MSKNIIVIYPNGFPIGGSATNRIISIARGLKETGNSVKIIITRPTESKINQLNTQRKGQFFNIEYEYSTNNLIWPKSKIAKFFLIYYGIIKTCITVFREHRKHEIDVVISAATYSFSENLPLYLLTRLLKNKLLFTVDEYPWVVIKKNEYSLIYRRFYLFFYYKLFDGFIVISKTLLNYYLKLSRKDSKFFHLPMTVELERFNNLSQLTERSKYIAYCGGDLSGRKDGVDILIRAFLKAIEKFPQIELHIAGNVHDSIYNIVKDNNLENKVVFLGFISRDKVPHFLNNAVALCLSRPNNIQAEGGFPTKLGEYLASGRPVIVTDVGEISSYLKNDQSAFIATPNDVNDFANKIIDCLGDYEKSMAIGLNGRQIALENFNYIVHKSKLSCFVNNL